MTRSFERLACWLLLTGCPGERFVAPAPSPTPAPAPAPAVQATPRAEDLGDFRAVAAPPRTWGDHVLRVAPDGTVWLVSFGTGVPGIQMTAWRSGGWGPTRTPNTPAQEASSPLDFEFDAVSGSVHFVYSGNVATATGHPSMLAASGPGPDAPALTTTALEGRALLGRDVGGRPVVLLDDHGLALRRLGTGDVAPLSIAMPEDAALLAFHVGERGDVRIAVLDRARSNLRLIGTDGAVETRIPDDFCHARFVSATFDTTGQLHAAADRCDGAHVMYIRGDATRGLSSTNVPADPQRRHAHPLISLGPSGRALIVFASTRPDLSDAQLVLAVTGDGASFESRTVGPFDAETERFTAAVVDGAGHVFIGSWGSVPSGEGLVRTTAPRAP